MRHRFGPKSGLSLLELLVSLALLALIGAGLSGTFGLGIRVWERSEALGSNAQEIALRGQLRRYMSQTLPPTRLTPFRNPFSGDSNGLSFVTLAETPFAPNAAAMRMTVRVDSDELQLQTELLDDDDQAFETWTDTLVRNVSDLRIDYYSKDDDAWLTEWTDDVTLPNLIRIRIAEGSEPPWPEFTVRPRLQ